MLVNLKEILALAEEQSRAVGAFNTPNLEAVMAALQTAEKHAVPIIIMHAQPHETVMPLEVIGPIMVDMAKKSSVPVCVHLDHGEDLNYLRRALEVGFSSVMYDGSRLDYGRNVENTRKAVCMAHRYSAGIEAEIGLMGAGEGGAPAGRSTAGEYTDPGAARRFVLDTGIDALACSFGTVHGFYTAKPRLDFQRIAAIRELTGLPLVMHGGSGVDAGDYRKAIANGVRKINYFSYMSLAGAEACKELLRTAEVKYFHELALAATRGMAADAERALRVFYGISAE
jgi:fructose-bisphosphate aldolase class II